MIQDREQNADPLGWAGEDMTHQLHPQQPCLAGTDVNNLSLSLSSV